MAKVDPDEQPKNASAPAGTDDELADEGPEDEYGYEDEFDDEEGEPIETIDEQGRRHIRRAAPEGTEQLLENEAPRRTGLSDRAERWRVRSATGTVLTAFAFGLQQAFEPNRNEPAIIMETSGDPPRDLPVEAELEQLGPRRSSVTIRPYLLGNPTPGKTPPPAAAEAEDDKTGPDGSGGPGLEKGQQ